MSNEELAAKIKAGESGLLPALWEQIEKFIRLQADRQARALQGSHGVDSDDLYQAGYLALLDAVDGYDPEAGKSFVGYLAYFLRREFRRAMGCYTSKRNPLDSAAALDAPIGEDEATTLLDTMADPVDFYEETEQQVWLEQLRAALDTALDTLPRQQGDTLRRWYFHNHTLGAIAADVGVSPERIRQHKVKALRNLGRSKALAQFVEQRTNYYRRVGVASFHATHTSAVERTVLERERLAARHARMSANS